MVNTTSLQEKVTTELSETTKGESMLDLSKEDLEIIQIINYVVISGFVCILGIIANIINIIIFSKQGLGDTVNISLFAITVSDLCGLILLEWININVNPFMDKANIPYEPVDVQYLTGGWPYAGFARIKICFTIYVTTERFCCIVFPLKIKQIITPTRTKMAICIIIILLLSSLLPEFVGLYLGEYFVLARNQTRVGLVKRPLEVDLEEISLMLHAVILLSSFAVLVLITSMLVISLERRSEWRKDARLDKDQSDVIARRDRRAMKMVSLIAIILIVCCTPTTINYITMFILPSPVLMLVHSNTFNAAWSVSTVAESINASVNILLFYKMSSKYRHTFHELFSKCITHKSRR